MNDKTRREELEEAFEESDTTEGVTEDSFDDEFSADGETTDEAEGEVNAKQEQTEEASTEEASTEKESEESDVATEQEAGVSERPPVSWKPAAREAWKDVPAAARREIERREAEITNGLQEASDGRKFEQQFARTIEPFRGFIAAAGGDPLRSVHVLMTTAAGLQVGGPVQKAEIVRDIIRDYAVDIQTLDNVLSNAVTPQHSASPAAPQIHPDVQRFMDEQRQTQANAVQATEAQINDDISVFASAPENEFFKDVRLDMADIMDLAANRGMQLTLQEAYDKACQLNPEISSIVNQRTGAKNARRSNVRLRGKKRAAKSVSGSPTGGGVKRAEDMSLRESLEAAVASNS
jgi:hypothetical protein